MRGKAEMPTGECENCLYYPWNFHVDAVGIL